MEVDCEADQFLSWQDCVSCQAKWIVSCLYWERAGSRTSIHELSQWLEELETPTHKNWQVNNGHTVGCHLHKGEHQGQVPRQVWLHPMCTGRIRLVLILIPEERHREPWKEVCGGCQRGWYVLGQWCTTPAMCTPCQRVRMKWRDAQEGFRGPQYQTPH